jgi:protein TonB
MTSKEILNAPMLDILFDNRNKHYGAYTLRKFYENRLAMALAFSLSAVFLVCLLISKAADSGNGLIADDIPDVIVREFTLPQDPAIPPPPPAAKSITPPSSSEILTAPVLVRETNLTNAVPDQNTLNNADNLNAKTIVGGGNGPGGPGVTSVTTIVPPSVKPEETDVPLIQRSPQFPGGEQAWIDFLKKWLSMPEDIPVGERKTVVVQFQVSEEGLVTNFEILRSAGRSFDNEVMRVLKKMPRWEPAIQNNRKVATTFQQPVTFTSYEN